MLSALLEPADLTADALALVAVVVAALSLMCLLAAGRAVHADRPLPRVLFVLTGAGIQVLVVLALAMLTVQATIEIPTVAVTP
jgi:hypothetical protein